MRVSSGDCVVMFLLGFLCPPASAADRLVLIQSVWSDDQPMYVTIHNGRRDMHNHLVLQPGRQLPVRRMDHAEGKPRNLLVSVK